MANKNKTAEKSSNVNAADTTDLMALLKTADKSDFQEVVTGSTANLIDWETTKEVTGVYLGFETLGKRTIHGIAYLDKATNSPVEKRFSVPLGQSKVLTKTPARTVIRLVNNGKAEDARSFDIRVQIAK